MKKFEILEHPSDLKIKAFGKKKKELFENAMNGMFESAKYESETKSPELVTKVGVKSLDLPSLLVDFLSEVLYSCEAKKEVYQKVNFKKFSEKEIEAILIGKKLRKMGVHIKGVTYYDLDIHQEKDGTWQATILFDI